MLDEMLLSRLPRLEEEHRRLKLLAARQREQLYALRNQLKVCERQLQEWKITFVTPDNSKPPPQSP